jgi:hypothetical protein
MLSKTASPSLFFTFCTIAMHTHTRKAIFIYLPSICSLPSHTNLGYLLRHRPSPVSCFLSCLHTSQAIVPFYYFRNPVNVKERYFCASPGITRIYQMT